jgi:hypothetical protein
MALITWTAGQYGTNVAFADEYDTPQKLDHPLR